MFVPLISSFKSALISKFPMYYLTKLIMPSFTLLCKFVTATNSIIYTFIRFLTQSATLILCCNYQTLSPFSYIHSEGKPNFAVLLFLSHLLIFPYGYFKWQKYSILNSPEVKCKMQFSFLPKTFWLIHRRRARNFTY